MNADTFTVDETPPLTFGWNGDDVITGSSAADDIGGNAGDDALIGTGGGDRLRGNVVDGTLNGQSGNDDLSGGEGLDLLAGGVGEDTLTGGKGGDILNGSANRDALTGGKGGGHFAFSGRNSEYDVVTEFNAQQPDMPVIDSMSFGGGLDGNLVTNQPVFNGPATRDFGQFPYNTETGQLRWDEDGTGGRAAALAIDDLVVPVQWR